MLRSAPPGPVKGFNVTFGPVPCASTLSKPMPRGCPICPVALSSSSLSRRVITAPTDLDQGDAARICLASSSVHWAAGFFQSGSVALRPNAAKTKQNDSINEFRIVTPKRTKQRPGFHLGRYFVTQLAILQLAAWELKLHHHAQRRLCLAAAKVGEPNAAAAGATRGRGREIGCSGRRSAHTSVLRRSTVRSADREAGRCNATPPREIRDVRVTIANLRPPGNVLFGHIVECN